MTLESVPDWLVEATRKELAEQGLPLAVEDPETVRQIRAILTAHVRELAQGAVKEDSHAVSGQRAGSGGPGTAAADHGATERPS